VPFGLELIRSAAGATVARNLAVAFRDVVNVVSLAVGFLVEADDAEEPFFLRHLRNR